MRYCLFLVLAPDESVDVFGPFTIEELQQYRSGGRTRLAPFISTAYFIPLHAASKHSPLLGFNVKRGELTMSSLRTLPPYTQLPAFPLPYSHPSAANKQLAADSIRPLFDLLSLPRSHLYASLALSLPHSRSSDLINSIHNECDLFHENLSPAGESVSRVPLNASDRDLAESLPLIRDILSQTDNSSTSSKFSHPPAAAALPQPPPSATADGVSCICYLYVWSLVHILADSHLKSSDFVTNMYLNLK
ncbi:unnamed protein product [Hymenolepis diminuta]|uniref:Uncharacterized protein n=1 Tax=Hymenolepis diminuta TaxID=6216 RepID=A0A0R3SHR9_HYMDI|nr:unnamed protein product [Hymenolepis diminuta]